MDYADCKADVPGERTFQSGIPISDRCSELLSYQMIKTCLREFSAVLVAITHTDGTVAVHVLNGSPL